MGGLAIKRKLSKLSNDFNLFYKYCLVVVFVFLLTVKVWDNLICRTDCVNFMGINVAWHFFYVST